MSAEGIVEVAAAADAVDFGTAAGFARLTFAQKPLGMPIGSSPLNQRLQGGERSIDRIMSAL